MDIQIKDKTGKILTEGKDKSLKEFLEKNSGMDFTNASFILADLRGARLWKFHFQKADFTNANLEKADFWQSNLRGVDLRNTDISKVDFQGVNLYGATIKPDQVSALLKALGLIVIK